jgi:succinyl-CoA synthetase beta subunit
MNIHEYQGKEILASYGVRIQRGIVTLMQLKLLLLQNN